MSKISKIVIVSLMIFSGSFVLVYAIGPEAPEIVFPVNELGGCKDKTECFAYCELPENGSQCLDFAKKYQLMSEDEIRVAEKVHSVKGGPGGCNSRASCENYCNNIDHIDQCLAFAQENNLMKGHDLEEAKKIQSVLKSGGKLPGGCKNKNDCEAYCHNADHMEECLDFAEKSGFIAPDELEQARKFMPLMKSGQTPGGCKSKNQCEAYCELDEHFGQCIDFAEKNGLLSEKDKKNIEAIKRTGGKGPGGCRARQCEVFCQKPENQEACFEWSVENGMLNEEDMHRMDEGRKNTEKVLMDAPAEVVACIEEVLGPGGMEKMRSGRFFGGEEIGEKMRGCFDEFGPRPPQPGFEGQMREEETESLYERDMERPIMQQPEEYRDSGGRMMRPKSGGRPDINPEQFQHQYNEEYKEQYEKQYRQMQEQYQIPLEGMMVPSDGQYQMPPQESMTQPPPRVEEYPQPQEDTYRPILQSMKPLTNMLGFVLGPLLDLLK